ncbi:M50 family metallopeptidase [Acetivibrio cellulolyticus]|uniref:M50 family metallopeptidase n=1 Tax=Acetivibrio cellulolyticus TaxID=35830 RepID=UPI0001E2D472|nr:M50 family metallopeptidase [Acetivibrio cellulolyticus]
MKNIWKYLLILASLVILWNQTVASPFKVLSSIFHKIGHALVSTIFGFGGTAFNIAFVNNGDAIVDTRSWITSFVIVNSGYISSILFSMLILYLKRTPAKKYMVGSITIIYLVFSIAFASSTGALVTSLAFSVITILILMIGKDTLNDLMLDVVGMSLAAYVIYDTFVDTILLKLNGQLSIMKSWSNQPPSDIVKLADLTGFPIVVWGLIWLAIAVVSVNMLLIKSGGKKK